MAHFSLTDDERLLEFERMLSPCWYCRGYGYLVSIVERIVPPDCHFCEGTGVGRWVQVTKSSAPGVDGPVT